MAEQEYGRIDIVKAGASAGGGIVLEVKPVPEQQDSYYLDITAKELWDAVPTTPVFGYIEEGGNIGTGRSICVLALAAHSEERGYMFSVQPLVDGDGIQFIAQNDDDKPHIDGGDNTHN